MQKLLTLALLALALLFVSPAARANGPGGPKCSAICTCASLCTAPCSGPGIVMTCGGFGECRSVPACKPGAAPAPLAQLALAVEPERAVCTAGDELDAHGCAPPPASPARADVEQQISALVSSATCP